MLVAVLHDMIGPDAGLYFPDVSFAQEEHTEPGLADPSSDGFGELPIQEAAVKEEIFSVFGLSNGQLSQECLPIDPNSHGRDLESPFQNWMPEDDIPIQTKVSILIGSAPIVVVRGSSIVRFPIGQVCADSDDEYRTVFSSYLIFPFLRGEVWVAAPVSYTHLTLPTIYSV